MEAIEIVVIVLAVLVVGSVIAKAIIDKKKGKKSCCSDCSKCKYNCPSKKEN